MPAPVSVPAAAPVQPAFLDFAALGYRDELVLVVPHDAPGPAPGKRPVEKAWQEREVSEDDLLRWSNIPSNVGLRARLFPAIDVDVDNLFVADAVEEVARGLLGATAKRVRSNSPRRLLPLALAGPPFDKAVLSFTLPDGTAAKVEILANGQQYVIAGTHHTGAALVWEPCPPSADSLPTMSREQCDELLILLRERLTDIGCTFDAPDRPARVHVLLRAVTCDRERGGAYFRAVVEAEPSVDGQRGSEALMRVVRAAVKASPDRAAALARLASWSAENAARHSTTEWTRAELEHALDNVEQDGRYGELYDGAVLAPPFAPGGPDREALFTELGIAFVPTRDGVRAHRLARNVELALAHLCGARLEYDSRANMILLDSAQLVGGSVRNRLVADVCGLLGWTDEVAAQTFKAGVLAAARRSSFDPVVRYLETLRAWDGVTRMRGLAMAFGVEPRAEDVELFEKHCIAAVRRAMNPGCKVDTALVLQGPQGFLKTTAIQTLAEAPGATARPLFDRTSARVDDKDGLMKLQGPWFLELAELSGIRGKDNDRVKAFMDQRIDSFRPPYGDAVEDFKRSCVFWGTTNEDEFLSDATGARRWWLARVTGSVDLKWIEGNRDLVWAEALSKAKRGDKHWFDATPSWLLERHEVSHEDGYLDELIECVLHGDGRASDWAERGWFQMSELLALVEVPPAGFHTPRERYTDKSAGKKLRRLGYERGQVRLPGRRTPTKVWRNREWKKSTGWVGLDTTSAEVAA